MIRYQIHRACFVTVMAILVFANISYAGDILFHEEFTDTEIPEAVMYRVEDDGSDLTNIGNGAFPQRSPNKNYFSFITYAYQFGQLLIRDEISHEILQTQKDSENLVLQPCSIRYCWYPDSKRVAYAAILQRNTHEGFIYIFDTKTRQTKKVHHFKYSRYSDAIWGTTLTWSPDGKYLLFNTPGMDSKNEDTTVISLIDPKIESVKTLEIGYLPRFVNDKKIVFTTGLSIWITDIDNGKKSKILDTQYPVVSLSEVINNKLLLQLTSFDCPEKEIGKLYCLDINNKKLESIQADKYNLFCPRFSPDGKKMTVIGAKVEEDNTMVGYYVYDLKTKEITLLKKLKGEKNEGFWFGLYFGYGNHTSWN